LTQIRDPKNDLQLKKAIQVIGDQIKK
jgi:hypothetical protein